MLTQEEIETELPPEGICDGKLGTGSLYHLCPVRDHQPDGELNLGRHGAFWLHFFSVDSHLADFVLQATFLTSLKALALLSTNPQQRQLVWAAVSPCGQSPGTGALARLNRTQHTPVFSWLYHPQTFQPGPSFQMWACSSVPGEAPSSFNPLQ